MYRYNTFLKPFIDKKKRVYRLLLCPMFIIEQYNVTSIVIAIEYF